MDTEIKVPGGKVRKAAVIPREIQFLFTHFDMPPVNDLTVRIEPGIIFNNFRGFDSHFFKIKTGINGG
jgi:hypothetical protein